jgi:hypothetical protein
MSRVRAASELEEQMLEDLAKDHPSYEHYGSSELPIADIINKPEHYTHSHVETIDAIEAWKLDFHLGNVVKYVSRAGRKGSRIEDLRKASWYLNRAIKKLEESA